MIGLIGLIHEEAVIDFWGTMEKVAKLGYQGIESPGGLLKGDVAGNLSRFRDLGLAVVASGTSRERLRDDMEGVVRDAVTLGAPTVVVYWAPCDSREQLLADCALYETAGARLAAEGVKLCYHNHAHELRTSFNGVTALDIMADNTDPAHLSFELDIAWLAYGGVDPASILRRMSGRVPAVHVKDMTHLDPQIAPDFTAVGTGVVPIKSACQAASEIGAEWLVVEQDTLKNLNAWDTITVSILNLKEMGF